MYQLQASAIVFLDIDDYKLVKSVNYQYCYMRFGLTSNVKTILN